MSHRILLVDDEAMLRNLMTSVLESAGYSVVAKESAEEVLALLESRDFSFDLVASDVQLERMDGIELAKIIHAAHPDVRVLLTTGYGGQVAGNPEYAVLSKPFRPADLIQAVSRALAAPQT